MNYTTTSAQAHELELYAVNTSELYPASRAIVRRMKASMQAGTYDRRQAFAAWVQWLSHAARAYQREIDRKQTFSRAAILEAAKSVAKGEEAELLIELGGKGTKPNPAPKRPAAKRRKAKKAPKKRKSTVRKAKKAVKRIVRKVKARVTKVAKKAKKRAPNRSVRKTAARATKRAALVRLKKANARKRATSRKTSSRRVKRNPDMVGRGPKTGVAVFDQIAFGDSITIVDRFGKERTGKAVMRGPAGWVLNMGGRHGTPGIASPKNITKVRKSKGKKPVRLNPSRPRKVGKAAKRAARKPKTSSQRRLAVRSLRSKKTKVRPASRHKGTSKSRGKR